MFLGTQRLLAKVRLGAALAGKLKVKGSATLPVDHGLHGGGAYTQYEPPTNAGVEKRIEDWLELQRQHNDRIDAKKSGRLQRLEVGRDEVGADPIRDPFRKRLDVYDSLLRGELLMLTTGDGEGCDAQLFDVGSARGALCLFTSMGYVGAFGEGYAAQLRDSVDNVVVRPPAREPSTLAGGDSSEEVASASDDKGIEEEAGDLIAVKNGEVFPLTSSLTGTWQLARDCFDLACKADDPAIARRLQVVVNPMSVTQFTIPQQHLWCLLNDCPLDLLVKEVSDVFGAFFADNCAGEVTYAVAAAYPSHPFARPDEQVDGPVLLLVLDSTDFDSTFKKLARAKQHSADLESFLTTFSMMHVHVPHELPSDFVIPNAPFFPC
ncbi:hypothetical protein DIPPA_18434 [Diplonema papillatum]|nr:hypothetical protein DIPPA_18434 [Diplonema papillatum]|eukprot:gene5318-8116_t